MMPAPECTCQLVINATQFGVARLIRCPLHEAAADLYEALEMLLPDAEAYWHQTLAGSPAAIQMARDALLKANSHRTQEVKDAG